MQMVWWYFTDERNSLPDTIKPFHTSNKLSRSVWFLGEIQETRTSIVLSTWPILNATNRSVELKCKTFGSFYLKTLVPFPKRSIEIVVGLVVARCWLCRPTTDLLYEQNGFRSRRLLLLLGSSRCIEAEGSTSLSFLVVPTYWWLSSSDTTTSIQTLTLKVGSCYGQA